MRLDNPFTHTTSATDYTPPPTMEELKMAAEIKQIEMETMMRQAEMEMEIQKARAGAATREIPFDETEEFRDYIVWLCGFTDREDPPDKEEWKKLHAKTGQIAAKFALRARDKAHEELRERAARDSNMYGAKAGIGSMGTLSGQGITGNQILMGNEEMIGNSTKTYP
jgi:hypothetical protein